MKNFIKSFAAVVTALFALSACANEQINPAEPAVTHSLKFVAASDGTKTTAFLDYSKDSVYYSWTMEDEGCFCVFEFVDGTLSQMDPKPVASLNSQTGKMSITATFEGPAPVGDVTYAAMLNEAVRPDQTATATAYDQQSDVLVSEIVDAAPDVPTLLRFKRENGFALMTATGLDEGEKVSGVSLAEKDGKILAAPYSIEKQGFEESLGSSEIRVIAGSAISEAKASVFVSTLPVEDAALTVGLVTVDGEGTFKAAYEKSFADGRSLDLTGGDVRAFEIGMNKVTELTLDLSIDETTVAKEDELSWDRTFVSVVAAKAESQTPTNNYYPGTEGENYTSTRFYKKSTLTFTPKLGLSVKEIVYEATTTGYATALVNSTWTNATASAAETTVTIIPADGTQAVSAVIGGTTGATKITIKYGIPVQPTPHTVTIDPNIEHGSVTATPSSDVMPGTEVVLTATPADNYVFDSWNVTAGDETITVTDNKFSMPNADVNVSATFKEKQGDESEASFVFNTDAGLAALGIAKPASSAGTNLGTDPYVSGAIAMTATDGGTATRVWNSSGNTDLRVYKNGGSLTFSGATISKIAFTGSSLTNQAASTGSYSGGTWTGSASSVTFTASSSVTIKTITVTYDGGSVVTNYTVSCNEVAGGTLSANPSRAEKDAEITLTATPDEGYEFNNDWTVKDASENPVTVTENKFKMPESNVTVTGSFTQKTYTIKRGTAEHGTFTINGTADDNQTAHKGDQITVAAEAESGYEHTGWTITKEQGGNVSAYNDNTTFTMPADNVTVTPVFTETASIPVYNSLADLVAAGKPSATETTVKVTLTNEVITDKGSSYICVKSGNQEVKLYKSNVPSEWAVGGTVSGTLQCPWLLYSNKEWELKPVSWDDLTYTPTCSTPTISFSEGKATISATGEGIIIMYAINQNADTQPDLTLTYNEPFTVNDGDVVWAKATATNYNDSEVVSRKYTPGGQGGGETKTLIIDGSKLTGTATDAAKDYTYGDFTITMSDGAKAQSSSGDNKFTASAILIGKSGKYIYNKTPIPGKITKFEIYANKGASTKVSVGVLFSTTAISAYATGTNTYTATLSTLDNVYDCSSKIPDGAKYFWYQVTNANNSQVQFRITYTTE